MFGANPIRKIDHTPDDGKLAVQEVFYTIQGEGPFSGVPALFIRLAGCHLACTFCDTEFESGINNRLSVDEIVQQSYQAMTKLTAKVMMPLPALVVLTGGEPMRQATGALCSALIGAGVKHVQLETAGNLWDDSLMGLVMTDEVSFVCSPKTPRLHPMIARHCRHFKYVVREGDSHPTDGLPIMPTQANQRLGTRLARPWDHADWDETGATIWVSPCDEHEPTKSAANLQHAIQLAMLYGYRISLQTHKMIGMP